MASWLRAPLLCLPSCRPGWERASPRSSCDGGGLPPSARAERRKSIPVEVEVAARHAIQDVISTCWRAAIGKADSPALAPTATVVLGDCSPHEEDQGTDFPGDDLEGDGPAGAPRDGPWDAPAGVPAEWAAERPRAMIPVVVEVEARRGALGPLLSSRWLAAIADPDPSALRALPTVVVAKRWRERRASQDTGGSESGGSSSGACSDGATGVPSPARSEEEPSCLSAATLDATGDGESVGGSRSVGSSDDATVAPSPAREEAGCLSMETLEVAPSPTRSEGARSYLSAQTFEFDQHPPASCVLEATADDESTSGSPSSGGTTAEPSPAPSGEAPSCLSMETLGADQEAMADGESTSGSPSSGDITAAPSPAPSGEGPSCLSMETLGADQDHAADCLCVGLAYSFAETLEPAREPSPRAARRGAWRGSWEHPLSRAEAVGRVVALADLGARAADHAAAASERRVRRLRAELAGLRAEVAGLRQELARPRRRSGRAAVRWHWRRALAGRLRRWRREKAMPALRLPLACCGQARWSLSGLTPHFGDDGAASD